MINNLSVQVSFVSHLCLRSQISYSLILDGIKGFQSTFCLMLLIGVIKLI